MPQISGKSFKIHIFIYLAGFVILALLIAFSALIATNRVYRDNIRQEIAILSKTLAQTVDRFFMQPEEYIKDVRNHINLIHTAPGTRDINCFIDDVLNIFSGFDSIYLLDPDGTVLDTWPFNSDLIGIDLSGQEYISTTVLEDQVYWSDSFLSQQTGLPTIALSVRSDQGILAAFYNLRELSNFVSVSFPDPDEFIAIIERDGNIIGHTYPERVLLLENLGNMNSFRQARAGNSGISEDRYLDVKGLVSVHQAEHSGFYVMVFKSYSRIFGRMNLIYSLLLLLLLSVSLTFAVLVLILIHRVMRPIDDLIDKIAQVSSGSYDVAVHSRYSEFDELISSFKMMVNRIDERENDLRQSLTDKDTLLRELYHRTKNNMQIIAGLMSLYGRKYSQEAVSGFIEEIQTKIQAISLVHEKLYSTGNLSKIGLKEYIEDLIPLVVTGLSKGSGSIRYNLDIEDVNLLIDYAVPCGLILNELITNSVKYAFPDNADGEITIYAGIRDNMLDLQYSDSGTGFPESFDTGKIKSLGLLLVSNIVRNQLRGEMDISSPGGVLYRIKIPLGFYSSRV